MVKLKLFGKRLDGELLHTEQPLVLFKHFKVMLAAHKARRAGCCRPACAAQPSAVAARPLPART